MRTPSPIGLLKTLLLGISVSGLIACGALHTSVKKSDLDVQTKTSESVFLEPVSPEKRVVFVSVRNTSDKDLEIKQRILERLRGSGYKITDDPDQAQFMLQANVLKVGKDDLRSSDSYLEGGFSGAVVGASVSSSSDTAKGAVLGAVLGVVADSLVDDTLYTMVTDLQVRERPRAGEVVTQEQSGSSEQGSSTSVEQSSGLMAVDWKTYRTRVVSTANQANLKFEEALPALESGLVRAIAGMFAE